jgi:hypothetical protein
MAVPSNRGSQSQHSQLGSLSSHKTVSDHRSHGRGQAERMCLHSRAANWNPLDWTILQLLPVLLVCCTAALPGSALALYPCPVSCPLLAGQQARTASM